LHTQSGIYVLLLKDNEAQALLHGLNGIIMKYKDDTETITLIIVYTALGMILFVVGFVIYLGVCLIFNI